ncbi:hypothetical protein SERLA73DRAFT_158983 [Serpula lacrymans var. lacrymans S7.3]|uniref:SVP1-like protein 2 n=2 Tax=Serpula lacrymans var. lacrymans TaxID=341189 RepID=F8PNV2_SERL3|nr:uncharacterized protein SERLADRAFT_446690 [Serpula lacrymans var. lacrymans S7.9]EGO01829.1 hypothetical protein SERLA73DRAFT_158983 [Serpula lacrymans var. lacrymans S7.3]EGO27458.1 hypothetical protein SERLADRAFT_446690 [Serpula lacrymans var. lacrymans S7.9]
MNLARHSITATDPVLIIDAQFDVDCRIFVSLTPAGFAVYRSWPFELIRKRDLRGGTLASVIPLHTSSLLFMLGGGRSPLYPPNKVILWDDTIGAEVAELEFRERVRGIACRRGWLAVALRRRVVVFEIGTTLSRRGEWDTYDNPRGLLAMATEANATLLAVPGRQMGHVQLIHLPPCSGSSQSSSVDSDQPAQSVLLAKRPISIIAAHESLLTTLTVTLSGRLIATTSSKGTLLRIWETETGSLVREFRRGLDKAIIYGVAFRPDENEVCVWSDKGTVHVFSLIKSAALNRQSSLSPLAPFLPLPKYFDSEWSYAQYRIPAQSSHIYFSSGSSRTSPDTSDEERCVVGWIQGPPADHDSQTEEKEHQLIALTYSGGWYRLSLPSAKATPPLAKSHSSPPRKSNQSAKHGTGKEKEKDGNRRESRECILREYRRFGRWDGW